VAGEATTGMEVVVESCQALELLVEKEVEAASKKRKRLGEMKDTARRFHAQAKDIVTDVWKNKAEESSREAEALRTSKAELVAKVVSLEAELSASAARNGRLELEAEASKKKLTVTQAALEAEKAKTVQHFRNFDVEI
jgi:hypothetical protein